jgi:hypothetical protein
MRFKAGFEEKGGSIFMLPPLKRKNEDQQSYYN